MKQLNNLLSKTRFAITERLCIADIMIGDKPKLTYKQWLIFLDENSDSLYVQSKKKKLLIKIKDNIYELYFIEKLDRHDYFKMLELCLSPIKIMLKDIKKHYRGNIDSYFGVSAKIKAICYTELEHDIFYIEHIKTEHVHDPIDTTKIDLSKISIIEERRNYIYFKIDDVSFEAKELVGSFDLYCGYTMISTEKNKNDVIQKAKSYFEKFYSGGQ